MAKETGEKVKKFFNDVRLGCVVPIGPVAVGLIFYLICVNHVGINEIGVAYDRVDGKIQVQDEPGYYITHPLVQVGKISTLPMKVTIPSNAAVINQKVVRFNKDGVEEYIHLQGFHWFMADSELEGVLMGYAFSGKKFLFLDVLQEAGPESVNTNSVEWSRASGATKPGK